VLTSSPFEHGPVLQSLNNLAVVLTSQGKAGEALSLLQAAISACPTYAGKNRLWRFASAATSCNIASARHNEVSNRDCVKLLTGVT
jgi:hypothetical protein